MAENALNAPPTLNHGNTFSAITSEEEADQNRHLSVDGSVTVDPSDALRCRKCDERIQTAQNAARGDGIPDCPQLGDRRQKDHRDEQDIQFTVPVLMSAERQRFSIPTGESRLIDFRRQYFNHSGNISNLSQNETVLYNIAQSNFTTILLSLNLTSGH